MGSTDSTSSGMPVTNPLTITELKGVYASANGASASTADIVRVLDGIIDNPPNTLTPAEIQAAITAVRDLVIVNSSEILYLHKLIGLLTFEIIEQGIKIESEELINQIEYLK